MELTPEQTDRAAGVLLATAAGDALGAPYEFGPPRGPDLPVTMHDGGSPPRRAGEWTDDTAMAVAIAEVAATGADLRDTVAQDRIVARWVEWLAGARDAGAQTRAVLAEAHTADEARAAAHALHERSGRTAGNGSLMRTAPVALAYLDDPDALVEAAVAVSELTHWDPEAGEACVLWCLAIRRAVLTGELDVRAGLAALPEGRAAVWRARLDTAQASTPADFEHNSWVVEALQGAWSAVSAHPDDLPRALEAAVRGGRDTDTVAAIAGGLAGARHGAAAVPPAWRALLHGWPGLRADALVDLASRAATRTTR
ncbi:ADP-ribosylglycohydrolase family protein [uncultured Jatrophihabitans sp.]|uniref:ADP-ribosylglycohydrolase family protein n=1 Tax=uncultured Jatrophihabitans sp. TaxID=1610747 RepID=UPI0035CA5119